ncbi:MAG: hypothetical protein HDT48_03765 [Ruminococcaceae bacterium]|nr:hypothetical protein [Oscillospiraceae bacterium]
MMMELTKKPLDMSELTEEQFNAEIAKGMADIENGRVYSAEEVERKIKEIMKSE